MFGETGLGLCRSGGLAGVVHGTGMEYEVGGLAVVRWLEGFEVVFCELYERPHRMYQ